jgi:hypothetical protein
MCCGRLIESFCHKKRSGVPEDLTEDAARDTFSVFGIVTACTVGRRTVQSKFV